MADSVAPNLSPIIPHLRLLRAIGGCSNLLAWDQHCYIPDRAGAGRGEQLAALSQLAHEKVLDKKFRDCVAEIALKPNLSLQERRCIEETQRTIHHAERLPSALVGEIADCESACYQSWLEARKANSFQTVAPILEKLVRLKIEYAKALEPEKAPYDTLLDLHERGLTETQCAALLLPLGIELRELFQKAQNHSKADSIDHALNYQGEFPRAQQQVFFQRLLQQLQFDLSRGRLDATVHPFCSEIGPDDVRLTTRFDERDILVALVPLIHEFGHGLYEQGLDPNWFGTAVGESSSMGIHESQSLLWERQVLFSPQFSTYLAEELRRDFPVAMSKIGGSELYQHLTRLRPSTVRLESDELTYGLHICIRFELEREFIRGNLPIRDLPEAWNDAYQRFLGLTPENDLRGVLQDVHWYGGSYGYFPTYLLGAIGAAQLFQTFCSAEPNALSLIEKGDFLPLKNWLQREIHIHGKTYLPAELMKRATGEQLNASRFVRYLDEKYCGLV